MERATPFAASAAASTVTTTPARSLRVMATPPPPQTRAASIPAATPRPCAGALGSGGAAGGVDRGEAGGAPLNAAGRADDAHVVEPGCIGCGENFAVVVERDVAAGEMLFGVLAELGGHAFPATAPAGDAPGPLEMLDCWELLALETAPADPRPLKRHDRQTASEGVALGVAGDAARVGRPTERPRCCVLLGTCSAALVYVP
jgi:hypothetical protein